MNAVVSEAESCGVAVTADVYDLLPSLLAAEEAHILNVCSFMGLVPWKRLPIYQASKYGLVGFTLALRNDYHRANFVVTVLCPGFVRTPMLENLKDQETHRPAPTPWRLLSTTPEEIANKAIMAIRRNRRLVVVTPFAKTMWQATRLCPSLVPILWCRSERALLIACN